MTVKTNGDMPAMPIQLAEGEVWSEDFDTADGFTKREAMAMRIMVGLVVGVKNPDEIVCSSMAVSLADALLAELERTKTGTKQQHLEVLAGWQLVPVEPTIEMVQAATHSAVGFGTRAAYQAMLAAAPKLEIKQ